MLYFLETLRSTEQTGGLLLGLVGVTYMVAGISSGYLADKYGRSRVMRVGLWVYLGGCLLGAFMPDIKWAFIFLPIFGLGGSIVLTLPYAILIRLMPKEHIGQFTGMFSMMRGFANIIAPVIAGGAIDIAGRIFHEGFHPGREYAVIWLVSGVMIAISLFFFRDSDKDDVVNV
jgi:MFS family permease